MPNTKHLIELQILEKCQDWSLEKAEKRGDKYDETISVIEEFMDFYFNADNNKEL